MDTMGLTLYEWSFNWEAENLPVIIQAWYGGQSTGTALADILFQQPELKEEDIPVLHQLNEEYSRVARLVERVLVSICLLYTSCFFQ